MIRLILNLYKPWPTKMLNTLKRHLSINILLAACFFTLVMSNVQAKDTVIIKAVGTWGYFTNYQKHEGPFWNKRIAEVTQGEIVGEINPQTTLGLGGSEIMRLVKKGVFDFAFGLPAYVSPESAIFEGADISSLVQNITVQKQVANAYFPTLARAFEAKYNAKLMTLYPFPSQMIWCKRPINNISELKGKRIRVYLTTLSDFVESVDAIPINAPFKDVPQALQQDEIDCAITGTMSAYTSELYRDAPFGFTLRVGWGLAFGAMNLDKWKKLNDKQQQILSEELAILTEQMWQETAKEDAVALACLSSGPCSIGENGNMQFVEPTKSDLAIRDRLALEVILPRWAKRCGPECATNWNRTVGKLLGLRAEIRLK